VAPAADETDDLRRHGPIGVLSGIAERVGGAVSETIGIDVEPDLQPSGNGTGPSRSRVGEPATPEAER
jgi:hypothetical protein